MTVSLFYGVSIAYVALLVVISFVLKNRTRDSMETYGKSKSLFGGVVITIVSIGAWVAAEDWLAFVPEAMQEG